MTDWLEPSRPGYKIFYYNQRTDEVVNPEDGRYLTVPEIEQAMRTVLTEPDNFFGLVDADEVILQFLVDHSGSVILDLPDQQRGGSMVKQTNLEECLAVVHSAGPSFADLSVPDLEFQAWE